MGVKKVPDVRPVRVDVADGQVEVVYEREPRLELSRRVRPGDGECEAAG